MTRPAAGPASLGRHARRAANHARAPGRVQVSLGELELVGFPVARRHAIAAAVQVALTELITREGLPPALASSPAPRSHRAPLDPQAPPATLGPAIAAAVYASLSPGLSPSLSPGRPKP